MNTSPTMRSMIEKWEGLRLTAYQDVVGVWTIGYGHTGPEVSRGMIISKTEADALLAHDLAKFEAGVARLIGSAPTTQGQFDGMVSLSYNVGLGNFAKSSVLRDHLAGKYDDAADAFELWDKAGGQVLEALHDRRVDEAQVYLDASP